MRPKAPRQIVRKFLYVYAAVCMALGRMTSLILPYANTEMMSLFLQEVAEDFKDFFVIMLIDRAGWHVSKKLKTMRTRTSPVSRTFQFEGLDLQRATLLAENSRLNLVHLHVGMLSQC